MKGAAATAAPFVRDNGSPAVALVVNTNRYDESYAYALTPEAAIALADRLADSAQRAEIDAQRQREGKEPTP